MKKGSSLRSENLCAAMAMMLAMLAMLVGGCNKSLAGTAYNALKTSAITVDVGMSLVGEMHAAGKITDERKGMILQAHQVYRQSYMVLVEALAGYKASQTGDAEARVAAGLEAFNRALAALVPLLPTEAEVSG